MDQILYITANTVHAFISAMMLLLLVRALFGMFADEGSMLLIFSSVVTEPIVQPIRVLLSKIPGMEDSPIDFSFMGTCLVLILLQTALPTSF